MGKRRNSRKKQVVRRSVFAGYAEYRYGSSKPVTLAGPKPKPVLDGSKRKAITDVLFEGLHWRDKPFRHEGMMRHGLRSAFCLAGHDWQLSDDEAARVVAQVYRLVGVGRPTWEEGQHAWTAGCEYCMTCRGPLDEEDVASRRRFCSKSCAQTALSRNAFGADRASRRLYETAVRVVKRATCPPKPCAFCGEMFQSHKAEITVCSNACGLRLSKGEHLLRPIACDGCGSMFQPRFSRSRFCSNSCSAKVKKVREREALAFDTRICACCNEPYTPTVRQQTYCTARCFNRAKARRMRARKREMAEAMACQPPAPAKVARSPAIRPPRPAPAPPAFLSAEIFDLFARDLGARFTTAMAEAA